MSSAAHSRDVLPIVQLVREKVKASGLSLRVFAEERGIPYSTIRYYNDKKRQPLSQPPRKETLRELALALDVPLGEVQQAALESLSYRMVPGRPDPVPTKYARGFEVMHEINERLAKVRELQASWPSVEEMRLQDPRTDEPWVSFHRLMKEVDDLFEQNREALGLPRDDPDPTPVDVGRPENYAPAAYEEESDGLAELEKSRGRGEESQVRDDDD